jgi:DnaD/phage-associated family protein
MNTDFYGERGQAIGEAARAYEEIMCRLLNRGIIEDIGYYIDRGCECDLIIKAIEITAGKGADWRYTKGILHRCLEEGIYTAYSFEWGVRFKKGLAEIKQKYGELDDSELCLMIMLTVFKEDVMAIQKDFERYLKALENGDISEWEQRWKQYASISE